MTSIRNLDPSETPALMSQAEIAEYFGVTQRTIRNHEARGLIKSVRICGGAPRYPRSELLRLIAEGTK